MNNFEKYNKIHNEVMKRLEEGEYTTEMAKEVNDLAFEKYITENAMSDLATKVKTLGVNIKNLINKTVAKSKDKLNNKKLLRELDILWDNYGALLTKIQDENIHPLERNEKFKKAKEEYFREYDALYEKYTGLSIKVKNQNDPNIMNKVQK